MTHSDIINLWPSLAEFAADIGVEYGTAKAMRRRESIPVEYWPRLIDHAGRRGIEGISPASLLEAAVKDDAGQDASRQAAGIEAAP